MTAFIEELTVSCGKIEFMSAIYEHQNQLSDAASQRINLNELLELQQRCWLASSPYIRPLINFE
jgi:hypothetical protein